MSIAVTEGRSNWPALAALTFASFVIGTAELIVVGVLNLVATDTGVSVATAGQVVTAYALGISIGGPLLTAATTRLGRRAVLRLALACFVAGNLLALTATGIGQLIIGRVITGSLHGMFIGVASVVATSLVPPHRRGTAMSLVFGGIAVAAVVGAPLGTLVGQTFGWRTAFAGIVAVGAVALIGTLLLIPPISGAGQPSLAAEAKAALAPRMLAMLGVGLLLLGGQFTVFTYLTPYLESVTGIAGVWVSVFLMIYGLASAAGTMVGGRLADIAPSGTLLVANLALVGALTVLYALGSSPVLTGIMLACWGFAGMGLVPSFQLRVIGLAGPGADLAATFGASAVNAGIAGGAVLGGWVVARYGPHPTALVGLIVILAAVPATWASRFLRARTEVTAKETVGLRDQQSDR